MIRYCPACWAENIYEAATLPNLPRLLRRLVETTIQLEETV